MSSPKGGNTYFGIVQRLIIFLFFGVMDQSMMAKEKS
jgi:hypothetical protein